MPLRLQLEVLGEVQVDRVFQRLDDSASNLTPIFDRLLTEFRKISEQQFLSQGSHGSGGWPALAESTLAHKRVMGYPPDIERATDTLFRSLTSSGPGSIGEVSKEWLRYGTAVPYAGYQQTGTQHMPQRRLVQLTEEERKQFASWVHDYVVTGRIP